MSDSSATDFLSRARSVCRQMFGFDSFREGQVQAIETVGAEKDCLVIMPTGSGKSLCYQVPALCIPGVTLVVSPLIALMKDQVDALSARSIPATFINSSLSIDEQWSRLDEMSRGNYRLVYVAPERFRSRAFRRALASVEIGLLAVDESHCISQWGHDFRPDYRRLGQVRELLCGVPVIALTATATPEVQDDIERELSMVDPVRIVVGFDRPNLYYQVKKTRRGDAKKEELARFVRGKLLGRNSTDKIPSGIVYAATRKHAEQIAMLLNETEWPGIDPNTALLARVYHAGLDDRERRTTQEGFMSGKFPWVAATNAFGMGVDKSDIRFVVHYDLPGSLEAYYQEVGRAGRDGQAADCLLTFSEGDRRLQDFFIEGANPSRKTIEAVHDFLWSLGTNPISRPLVDLEAGFERSGLLSDRVNPMGFRSSIILLERAGALERLDRRENLAEFWYDTNRDWRENPYSSSARVRSVVWSALQRIYLQNDGEPASIQIEHWSAELNLPVTSLRRAFAQLDEEGWVTYTPPFRGRKIRLPDVRKNLVELGMDFESLHQKRLREEERLQQMLSFARSRQCRRNQILQHFGEEVPGPSCGSCDLCRSDGVGAMSLESRELADEELVVVRKILSGVGRVRSRCGRQRLIQMLVGSKAEGVVKLGLDRLSTFGILSDRKQTDIRDVLDQLEMAGCLRQEGDRYPVLALTERGWRVIMEEEALRLACPSFASPSGPGGRADRGTEPSEDDEGPCDDELYERLRHLRYGIASRLGVPAYQVFSNRTLRAMASTKPQNAHELREIKGVGPITFEKFGTTFLEEIRRKVP